MDKNHTILKGFFENEWLINDEYYSAAKNKYRELLGINRRIDLKLHVATIKNKIVFFEENISKSKTAVLYFDNCKQLLNYMNYLEKLMLLATLKNTNFQIKRNLSSKKSTFTYNNDFTNNIEAYEANSKAAILDQKTDKIFLNPSDSHDVDKEILKILHISHSKIKLFGHSEPTKKIDFTEYGIDIDQINKISKLIYPNLNLTKNNLKALEWYKGFGSPFINGFLNYSKEQIGSGKFAQEFYNSINGKLIENIRLIMEVINNNELENNQVLYRTGSGKSKNLEVNEKINYDSFISTSASKKMAEDYRDEHNRKIIYTVCMPKGSKCIPLDTALNIQPNEKLELIPEAEFLLPPTTFKISDLIEGPYGEKTVLLTPISSNLNIDSLLKKSFEYWKDGYIDHKSVSEYYDSLYDRRIQFYPNYKRFLEKNPLEQKKFKTVLKDLSDSKYMSILIDQLSDSKFKTQYLYKSELHGQSHNERVAFLVAAISYYENLPKDFTKILLDAAKYHDIGRENDDEAPSHGGLSAKILLKENIVEYNNPEDLEILKYIITNHSIKTAIALENVKNYNITNIEKAHTLLKCLKDADNLDRVRLNDLDPNYLRTTSGKALVKAAYQLYPRYKALFEYEKLIAASFPSESPHTKQKAEQVDKSKYAKLKLILSKALIAFKNKMKKPEVPKDLAANKTDLFEF